MARKKVALVMPALNEAANVAGTFDAIFDSTRLPDEIVVADGHSSDDTLDRIRAYADRGIPITIVTNDAILPGAGRNAAVNASNCEIILLLDFGNKPEREWIEKMASPFEDDDEVDIVAGTYLPFATTEFEHCVAAIHYHLNYVQDRFTYEERVALAPSRPTPGGLSVGYSRSLWLRLGGQPTWLRTCEDVLFSRKAMATGAKLYPQFDARSRHHMRASAGAFCRQIYLYSRGHGQTRSLSMHFVKLVGLYGLFAGFAVIGIGHPLAWVVLGLGGAGYFYRTGIRKLIVASGRVPSLRAAWYALVIVVVRDVATLAGHAVGWIQFLTNDRLRRLFYGYVGDTDPDAYSLFPNR